MVEITLETPDISGLSQSLEDYLIAIWQLANASQSGAVHTPVRVKDIAGLKGVKPGSVSPAMERLSRLGMIIYDRRSAISLTATGADIADRLMQRHRLLSTFFEEILKLPPDQSLIQASAVAHSLTTEATQRLELLIQFIRHHHDTVFAKSSSPLSPAIHHSVSPQAIPIDRLEITIAEMLPGQRGVVRRIRAQGELNHQLIDMGLLPDASIQLISGIAGATSDLVVALQGFEVRLTVEQAGAVMVSLGI